MKEIIVDCGGGGEFVPPEDAVRDEKDQRVWIRELTSEEEKVRLAECAVSLEEEEKIKTRQMVEELVDAYSKLKAAQELGLDTKEFQARVDKLKEKRK